MKSKTALTRSRRPMAVVGVLLGVCLLATPAVAGKKKEKADVGSTGGLTKPSNPQNKPSLILDTTKPANIIQPMPDIKAGAAAEAAAAKPAVAPLKTIDGLRVKPLFEK